MGELIYKPANARTDNKSQYDKVYRNKTVLRDNRVQARQLTYMEDNRVTSVKRNQTELPDNRGIELLSGKELNGLTVDNHSPAPAPSESLAPASAPIEAVLADTPSPQQRAMPQMQADVDDAATLVQRLVARAKSMTEVETWFPALMHRFSLRSAQFINVGKPDVGIELQVNPKAVISSPHLMLNNPTQSHSGLAQNVSFKTANVGGDTVGIGMEAKAIGPTHPQGQPPASGALAGIMGQLPTDPKLPGIGKFIKGHLLNDNLGGPGVAENLFPITAQANKLHEQYVESWIKEKVNLNGYWVYYRVNVNVKGGDLKSNPDNNWINSDLACEAQLLDASGKKTGKGINYTIPSIYQGFHFASHNKVQADFGASGAGLVEPYFQKNNVEWSTSKNDDHGPQEIDEEIRVAMRNVMSSAATKSFSINDIKGSLIGTFGMNSDSLELALLMDPALGMSDRGLDESVPTDIGQWNRAVGVLNNSKDVILAYLVNLKQIVDNYSTTIASPQVGRASRNKKSTDIRRLATQKKYKLNRFTPHKRKNSPVIINQPYPGKHKGKKKAVVTKGGVTKPNIRRKRKTS